MISIKKFLIVGALALSAGLMLNNQHTNTSELTNTNSFQQSLTTIYDKQEQEVQKYVNQDVEFLKTINPKITSDLNIILKDKYGLIDSATYAFRQLKYKLSHSEEDKNKLDIIAGNVSLYNKSKIFGNNYYTLVLGVNMVENPSSDLNGLVLAFNGDKEKITSFILFHEAAHHIFSKEGYDKIFNETITKIETNKNISFSTKDKEIIKEQFSESFADSVAIQLVHSKYPTVNIENVKNIISGWRLDKSLQDKDFQHITSVALEQLKLNKNPDNNYNNILTNAITSAKMAINFASDINFSPEQKIKLTLDSKTEQRISDNIQKMREFYLEQQAKTTIKNK